MSAPAANTRSPPVTTTAPGGSRVRSAAAVALEVGAVARDGVPEVVGALAGRRDRAHDRWSPPAQVRHVEHRHKVALGLLDAGTVGLVDHEHVGHLEQPGLVGLYGIPPSG